MSLQVPETEGSQDRHPRQHCLSSECITKNSIVAAVPRLSVRHVPALSLVSAVPCIEAMPRSVSFRLDDPVSMHASTITPHATPPSHPRDAPAGDTIPLGLSSVTAAPGQVKDDGEPGSQVSAQSTGPEELEAFFCRILHKLDATNKLFEQGREHARKGLAGLPI